MIWKAITAPAVVRVTTVLGMQWALPKSQHYPMLWECGSSGDAQCLPRCQGSGFSASWRKEGQPPHPASSKVPPSNFGPSISAFLELLQVINGSKASLPSGFGHGSLDFLRPSVPAAVGGRVGGWMGPPDPARKPLHPILAPGLSPPPDPRGQSSL